MGHVFSEMFAWPDGIVVGNLIASGITAILSVAWMHWRHTKLHKRIDALEERLFND